MKTLYAILLLCALITMPSCEAIQQNVAIVNDRRPDGTYLPLAEVLHPTTGSPAIAKGSFYIHADGTVSVTGSYGPSGPVAAPKFAIPK